MHKIVGDDNFPRRKIFRWQFVPIVSETQQFFSLFMLLKSESENDDENFKPDSGSFGKEASFVVIMTESQRIKHSKK